MLQVDQILNLKKNEGNNVNYLLFIVKKKRKNVEHLKFSSKNIQIILFTAFYVYRGHVTTHLADKNLGQFHSRLMCSCHPFLEVFRRQYVSVFFYVAECCAAVNVIFRLIIEINLLCDCRKCVPTFSSVHTVKL